MSIISNPFLPSPRDAESWAKGFIAGFSAEASSPITPSDLEPESIEPFNQGVLAGQSGALEGLQFSEPCLDTADDRSESIEPTAVIPGVEILHGLWELRALKTLAGGLAGLAVAFVELACTLPTHHMAPAEVLPDLGEPIINELSELGIGPIELFCAAGMDLSQKGCDILLSPMFKSVDQARTAATSMGRPTWLVARWRTQECGSFKIVDGNY